jgi:hypothetical protein
VRGLCKGEKYGTCHFVGASEIIPGKWYLSVKTTVFFSFYNLSIILEPGLRKEL